jgi:hypothetical protein
MRTTLRLNLLFLVMFAISMPGQQPILTKSYDAARTSATTNETTLTPAAVARGMTKLANVPIIGDARGMEAEPLVDSVNGRAVMILPSEANVIRGVAPADGAGIWQTPQLCMPVKSTPENDMWGINDHFGMLSTGVIDGDTHRLYQVATCSSDGSGLQASMQQWMYVLDTATGNVILKTLVTGSSNGFNYQDAPRKQRSALLLWKQNGVKVVMVMAGSFSESGATATGWLLAFDTFDNQFKAALSTHAGGWMSGQGPAMEAATGLIYLGLGNGPYNATSSFGEAQLQIRFTPPTATTAASFTVLRSWAPFLDQLRSCSQAAPALVAGQSAPSMAAAMSSVPGAAMPMNTTCNTAWSDQDANLTGTLLEDFHLYVTAGKDGVGYVSNTQAFPNSAVLDFGNPKANCAKVKMYQFGWDLGVDTCPAAQSRLNVFPGGKTRHQHSPIVQYRSAAGNTYLLFFAENSPLQVWKVGADGSMTYVARGTEMASASVASGMPGGFGSVSSNSGANGIAWYSIPVGDANRTVTQGFLAAYDLTVLDTMKPGGTIPTLWKSGTFVYNKFSAPIVWNGQVYLADYAGSLMHFGLAAQ